jgi:pimeloyl-ACP methyl ester carboxylesterase
LKNLADRGLFVIRFDHRDVGRSSCSGPGRPAYDVDHMVGDALGVLDSYGLERAHLVGMSLGGMLAQIAALRFPERVQSLTAIASGVWDDRPDLPGVDATILSHHARAADVDWSDEASVQTYIVNGWRLLAGSRHPFDEASAARLAVAEFRRARSLPSMFNHAQLGGAEDLFGRVPEILAPLLVIHGTTDPVLPYPHATALAQAASNARLVKLEGGGHELHRSDWGLIIDEIETHIRAASEARNSSR